MPSNVFENKVYEVGGSLRNSLLNLPINDIDFVIEGVSEEEMEFHFPNTKVGKDFPVYIIDGNEYALTRTEQNSGNGYNDFEITGIGVSIEKDLSRRDLTINSISKNVSTGEIIDPYDGRNDIKERILRTINKKAFQEDPVRILRLARFAAELDFTIDKETIKLATEASSKLKFADPHRIHLELKKVYKRSNQPSIFFRVLSLIDGLKYNFKPLYIAQRIPAGPSQYHSTKSVFDHSLDAFDNAKLKGHSFEVAVASLFHDISKILSPKDNLPHHYLHEVRHNKLAKAFLKQHKFTRHEEELILNVGRNHMRFHILEKIKSPVKLIRFYKEIKKYVDEVIQSADNDHELNEGKLKIIEDLKRTFKETEIDVPKEILNKGKEVVVNFVEQKYVQKYKEIKIDNQ